MPLRENGFPSGDRCCFCGPYRGSGKYVKAMRSSIILLGALLGRMKEEVQLSRRLSDRCKTGRSASDGP